MISALIKLIIPFGLILLGLFQTIHYRRVSKNFDKLPVVACTIIESKLLDDAFSNPGKRIYEAQIKYKYTFRGQEYIGETPSLRGYELWPDLDYEWVLLRKYKENEIFNAHVLPNSPKIAYLEVAPLDKRSAILMPFVMVGYLAFIWGYFYLVGKELF